MCDSRDREWRFYLDDMIEFAEMVLASERHHFHHDTKIPPAARLLIEAFSIADLFIMK
jgi:hypothetical protein